MNQLRIDKCLMGVLKRFSKNFIWNSYFFFSLNNFFCLMVKTSSENYSLDVLLDSSEFFLFSQFSFLLCIFLFLCLISLLWVFLFKLCQKHKIEINFNILWKRKNNLFSNTVTEYWAYISYMSLKLQRILA